MKRLWNNLKNWQKIVAILGFLAVIIVIVVAVVQLVGTEPKVELKFTNTTNIPSGELIKVRKRLVKVISDNTENFDDNKVYVGEVRDYNEGTSNGLNTASFIADFDEIKESYAVTVWWPDPNDGSPNLIVSCPLLDSKYPETPCVTETNSSFDIESYLPHTGSLSSGDTWTLNGEYDGGKLYLKVTTNGDANEALAAAKKWISDLGFTISDYQFFVPANQYIQANHANTNDANVNNNLPYFLPNVFNVYPVTENGAVTAIKAEVAGCTDAQTNEAEEQILEYLKVNEINYPVEFEYCAK